MDGSDVLSKTCLRGDSSKKTGREIIDRREIRFNPRRGDHIKVSWEHQKRHLTTVTQQ